MMKRFFASAFCFVLASGLVLSGCGEETEKAAEVTAEEDSDVIKIGLLESLTGVYAAGAAEEIAGAEFAHSQRPAVTVDGKEYTVELVKADDESDRERAAEAARELIEDENVTAIIGSYSSVPSAGASQVISEGETPAVGASCTTLAVTEDNDWYFRVCYVDRYQGTVMAQYAYETVGAVKVGVVYDVSSDYSTGLAHYFMNDFKSFTGDDGSVAEVTYQTGDDDFTAQIEVLETEGIDCLFVPGNYRECALFIKQLRQQGIDVPVLGGDTFEIDEFLETGGDEVNGVLFSSFFDPSVEFTSKTADFIESYREANETEPTGSAALAYDAYMLICDALESCGSVDKTALRDAIASVKYEGVTGNIEFDENGDPSRPAVIKRVNTETQTFDYVAVIPSEQ